MNCMSFDSEHFPSVDRFELELICCGAGRTLGCDYVSVYLKRLLCLMTTLQSHLPLDLAVDSCTSGVGFLLPGMFANLMPQLSRKLLMLPGFGGCFSGGMFFGVLKILRRLDN